MSNSSINSSSVGNDRPFKAVRTIEVAARIAAAIINGLFCLALLRCFASSFFEALRSLRNLSAPTGRCRLCKKILFVLRQTPVMGFNRRAALMLSKSGRSNRARTIYPVNLDTGQNELRPSTLTANAVQAAVKAHGWPPDIDEYRAAWFKYG